MSTSYIWWLSRWALVHYLAWALLATSCRVILQSTTCFFLRRGLCISLLFTDDALSHLSGYIISQNTKTHMHCMIILGICRGLVFGVQCLEIELWDHFSLKRQLLRKIIETTGLNSLLCWNRMNGIAGFSKMGRPPYCEKNESFLAGLLR